MMDFAVVSALKNRYSYLPPLLVSRSVERAANAAELFDILDTTPDKLPVSWDSINRRWVSASLAKAPSIKLLKSED